MRAPKLSDFRHRPRLALNHGTYRRALVQGKTPFVEGAIIEDDEGRDLSAGSIKEGSA